MQEKCPVCKNSIKTTDKACSVCGFTDLHREFITKEDGELWIKNVVEPYKKQYEVSKKPVLDDGFDSDGYNKDGFDRDGSIKEVNESQEIIDLKRRANSSDAVAQNKLGMCYQNGMGVDKDINMAIYYYEQAIKNGSGIAAHNLASVYDKVTPEHPNDYEKAFKYYKLAEERGYSSSYLFNNLGVLYADGKGVEKNYEMAEKYYEKAISMGNAIAEDNLGRLLMHQLDLDANRVELQNKNFDRINSEDKKTNIEPYIIWLIVCVLSVFTAMFVVGTLGEKGAEIGILCFIVFIISILGAVVTYKS